MNILRPDELEENNGKWSPAVTGEKNYLKGREKCHTGTSNRGPKEAKGLALVTQASDCRQRDSGQAERDQRVS